MQSIPSRIYPLPAISSTSSTTVDEPEDPIDIFSASLSSGTLFPDHAITSHGDPGGRIGYTSPRFGEIVLNIPVHPDEEVGRGLFAHYLWSAAAIAAAAIEQGSSRVGQSGWWDCRGCDVLEVGAGTALPSLIAALSSARSIYITDHPSSPALTAGSIVSNVKQNLFPEAVGRDDILTAASRTRSHIKVLPHVWGQLEAGSARDLKSTFDKIIVADCLWMSSQHDNLITSILHFLRPISDVQKTGLSEKPASSVSHSTSVSPPSTRSCAYVIAGFHTGRRILAWFFEKAVARGLVIEEIWEVDVGLIDESEPPTGQPDLKVQRRLGDILEDGIPGLRRPWLPDREGESKEEAKKWCVVSILTVRGEVFEDGSVQERVGSRRSGDVGSQASHLLRDDKVAPEEGSLDVDDTGWI